MRALALVSSPSSPPSLTHHECRHDRYCTAMHTPPPLPPSLTEEAIQDQLSSVVRRTATYITLTGIHTYIHTRIHTPTYITLTCTAHIARTHSYTAPPTHTYTTHPPTHTHQEMGTPTSAAGPTISESDTVRALLRAVSDAKHSNESFEDL